MHSNRSSASVLLDCGTPAWKGEEGWRRGKKNHYLNGSPAAAFFGLRRHTGSTAFHPFFFERGWGGEGEKTMCRPHTHLPTPYHRKGNKGGGPLACAGNVFLHPSFLRRESRVVFCRLCSSCCCLRIAPQQSKQRD